MRSNFHKLSELWLECDDANQMSAMDFDMPTTALPFLINVDPKNTNKNEYWFCFLLGIQLM